jgi:HTH-type transcriptional regulator, sugar sensing transcriptional regulator
MAVNIELLEAIGLTKSEIHVYLALLELGLTTTGPLVDTSGASSSKIYEILDKLIQKGLASYIIKSGTKHFEAAPPQRILDYLQEKQKVLQEQTSKVQDMLPELELKQTLSKYKSDAVVYKGMKGLETCFQDVLKTLKKGEINRVFIVGEVDERLNDFFKKHYSLRAKKRIKTKTIFSESGRKHYESRKHIPLFEGKVIGESSSPATINVYGDKVNIRIGGSKEVLAILIDNKELATSFREQFDALWNQDVIVHKGFERVTERFWSMLDELKKGEEYQVLGATYGQGGKKLQDWFARYHAERVKRGIPARLLTVAKDYGVVVKEFMHAEDPNFENALKRLSPEFSSPMQINLYPNNKVLMFLFGKDMMCFEIDSSVVHTNFKNQFDALWNQETRVEKGLDAVQNIFEEILASGHADFIGARGYFIDYRQEFMKEWEKRAKKRGFTMRNLVDKESKGHTITQFPFAETKYTLSKEFSTLSVFWIYGNKVVISNWMDKDNPIVVIIENKRIHDMYKQQFELLWKK